MIHRYRTALLLCVLVCWGYLTSQRISAQSAGPIVLLSPGPQSLVTSPIQIRALVHPGESSLVRVTLVDRQQNLLARQVLRINAPDHDAVDLTTELAFEVPVERTAAFLTIMTQDHFNRPIAIRSVPIRLQSSGEMLIAPLPVADPWLEINQPKPGAVINDSPIIVTGRVRPINERPVIFELITERGRAIVTRQLAVETPGEWVAFEIPLPYLASSQIRDMRLTIRQSSGIAGVNLTLDSLPLTIVP